jgi:hypothetical protein
VEDRNGDAASIDGGHGSLVSGTEMNRETSCVPVSFPDAFAWVFDEVYYYR